MLENIFSFENQNVRVAVMNNGGAYARSLTKDNHSVESTTVSNERTRTRLVKAWQDLAAQNPQATQKDFYNAGLKIRGVRFSYRSY